MENNGRIRKKRSIEKSDVLKAKRSKHDDINANIEKECTAGKVKLIRVRNFMCHDALEIIFNENVNFIVGRNGSGKSAILTALVVGLGAKANVTSRGTAVKQFVKKGRNSATIEVILINEGCSAYKPEIYGNEITIIRTIGSASSYKIKNSRGEIVSTKRDELENIKTSMNIQIDNPISILNQDVSRTFLVASKPAEKYSLFMKATFLDTIEDNYKEALHICQEEHDKLNKYSETLSQAKAEIRKLEENIQRLEEIDVSRVEVNNLELEHQWAMAISEETKLHKIQQDLDMYQNSLEELQDAEVSVEAKNQEIDEKIKEIKAKIEKTEQESIESNEAYSGAKQKYSDANELYSNKMREWRSATSKIKRLEEDINLLQKEIQKLESCNNEEHIKKKEMTDRLSKFEEKLDEVEASLRTKQTELMHLEADKMRLSSEEQRAKIEIDNANTRTQKIRRQLLAFEEQSDNSLSVFGVNIPRLLRRIEEEYKKGRFKEKPRGPIGAYMKMKDAAWAPAVESYLGYGTLSTFCVDNSQDAKLLTSIMKEIFYKERSPQIISSKFYDKIHDVRGHCTKSPQYSNLLDAMEIGDSIVANCLIDQREIECVLLIPSSQEACEIMSDAAKVPRHCKRAFTQQCDTFFPDPNYRSYGGKVSARAKFLQVSTTEAIEGLKEELDAAENIKQEAKTAYDAVYEKVKRTNSALNTLNSTIHSLRSAQNRHKASINDLKDKLETIEATSANVFQNESVELKKQLVQERSMEKILAESAKELQGNVKSLDMEVKRYRDLRHSLHLIIDPMKDQIKELTEDKDRHRFESKHSTRKLQAVRQAIQCATGQFEAQERVATKAISDATTKCSKINTTRSINQIKTLINELKGKIKEAEHQFGSLDDLQQELKKKQKKYGENIKLVQQLNKTCEKHIKRVKYRQKMYIELRKLCTTNVQKAFTEVLALRQYKGNVIIDHVNKVLELHVTAREDKKSTNDVRSLSGGERSYSTVAFILALWDCIQLPFYFLDEFDVFMDKVNRRVIMDILLDHSKLHPQSQFGFLTPLDTSHILAEDYVTIHQLQPPERNRLSQ